MIKVTTEGLTQKTDGWTEETKAGSRIANTFNIFNLSNSMITIQ